LGKYPPLEGGIAAKTYWLARGLALRGHTIHIITNEPSAGCEYKIQGSENPPTKISNIWFHRSLDKIPWHLPEDNENAFSLLNTTLEVIRDHKIQLIDTGYLVPYGIVGYLAKKLTGISHVVRHGGSDIEKFLKKKFGTLYLTT